MANVSATILVMWLFALCPSVHVAPTHNRVLSSVNVFKGLLNNPLFCGILIVTSGLQIIIVQYGSFAFHVSDGGLSLKYWGVCLGFGAFSLIVQQVINVLFAADKHYLHLAYAETTKAKLQSLETKYQWPFGTRLQHSNQG